MINTYIIIKNQVEYSVRASVAIFPKEWHSEESYEIDIIDVFKYDPQTQEEVEYEATKKEKEIFEIEIAEKLNDSSHYGI